MTVRISFIRNSGLQPGLLFRQGHLGYHNSELITDLSRYFEIVEDVIPLYDLKISLRTGSSVRKADLVTQQVSIPVKKFGSWYELVISKLAGHQMIELT